MKKFCMVFLLTALVVLGFQSVSFGQGWENCTNYEDYLHWTGRVEVDRAYSVAQKDNFVYVGSNSTDYIKIIDVSNLSHPQVVGTYNAYYRSSCIEEEGSYLYAVGENNLRVFSISSPTSLQLKSTIGLTYSLKVSLSDTIAVVARQHYGVSFVDVSNPSAPSIISTISTPGNAYDVVCNGTIAYVADQTGGVQIIDFSNPTIPEIVGWLPTATATISIAQYNGIILVGCDNAIQVIDATIPSSPQLLSSLYMPADIYGVWLDSERAYLAALSSGLISIDISNPQFPSIIGNIETFDAAYDVHVTGNNVFVADYNSGLLVATSINDKSVPIIGRWDEIPTTRVVSAQGNNAFVVSTDGYLRSFDCSYPPAPAELSTYNTGYSTTDFEISEQFAYLSVPNYGLRIVDVSNPEDLQLTAGLPFSGPRRISVTNRNVYVSTGGGLKSIDVSNIGSPVMLAEIDVPNCDAIDSQNDLVVVGQSTKMSVVSVSNPEAPEILSVLTVTGNILDVAISGRLVFLACENSGLTVVDITVPSFPVLISNYDTPGTARAVSVTGNKVIVADGVAGYHLFDISNPAIPTPVGTVLGVGNAYDVAVQADFIFTASYGTGMALTVAPCPNLNIVTVSGSMGSLFDVENVAGIHIDGTDGFDPDLESLSPPSPPAAYLNVAFYHPEWNVVLGDNFNQDYRATYDPNTESKIWPMRVETDETGEVTLTFTPNFGQGNGWGPWLRDMTSGMFVSLFPDLTYSYQANGSFGLPDVREFELIVGGQYGIPPLTPESRDLPTGWSMLGLPLIPPAGQDSWAQVLLDDANGPVYMYSYNDNGVYESRYGHDVSVQSSGVWAGSLTPFTWSMGGSPDLNGTSVPVRNGWTLMGYPLWIGTDLSSVQVDHGGGRYSFADAASAGLIAGSFFDYDDSTGAYIPVTSLSTWHGYWVSAYEDSVSLWFDYRNAGAAKASSNSNKIAANDGSWDLSLGVAGSVAGVRLGSRSAATVEFDAAFDLPSPPSPPVGTTSQVSLFISRPEWDVSTGIGFLSDYVGTGTQSYIWDVRIIQAGSSEAVLGWDPQSIPAGSDLMLYSMTTEEVLVESMATESSYRVPLVGGQAAIQVRLNAGLSSVGENVPTTAALRNSPNPFNPATNFHFVLEKAGEVKIRVYDVRGQLVKNLEIGRQGAGAHTKVWRGVDNGGRQASSGSYLALLFVDGVPIGQVAKLSLIR